MPDVQQFSITRAANKALTVPTWDVQLLVVDPKTGVVLRDFTGVNGFSFPQVLSNLTASQQDDMVALVMNWLIGKRSGLW